ncbi:peptidyl-dipeptidase Dcp [Pseudolysinimonas kribbensis]|uniref:Peptidyl-dipeptidase Dcp n=1 Tax=Pseudolysinimonas kribbensis TaxID=433641 RepID=A0ABQ6KDM6_9MICO|nr:peptidyl-dipeptidase Dcp [Pseudolysinimonas kribbensis]
MVSSANPFFDPSTLPFGFPPFADIRDEHYEPAFERGMADQLAEIQEIVRGRDEPTFDNTLVPLERSGQILERVGYVFFNKSSSDSSDFTNELEERIAPKLAAHHDAILLDPMLYWRVKTIHDAIQAGGDAAAGLDAEQRYLVERWYTEMTIAGAALDDAQKRRLRELNQEISTLTTRFEKNLLNDTNELAVHVTDVAELAGLGEGEVSAAREAAAARDLEGWLVTLVLPTGHPWLASLTDRGLRERIMTASRSRGGRGGEHDNRENVLRIARLRAERAELLGFSSHAAAVTADETARTPEAVADMLGRLAPAAARNARAEQADLAAVAGDLDGGLRASDWSFYTEKVRAEKYDVDTAALRPWFEAERVLHDGVFYAAHLLYGVSFTERPDLVAYHPDARVFEVSNEDGSALGLYILDLYTRDSKRGGAWMNPLISQDELLGHPGSVVVNNLNVPKPAAGQPTLLTFDEVSTFFHEFGHALHGLFAHVTYPKFSGTNVFRDFVEFPSQVNEMWMLWPEVLENYARHHETGEPLDPAVVERIRESEQFNQGFATSEYLGAALLDQAWHKLSSASAEAITDVAAFEADALRAVGLDDPLVPPRYGSTYFAHVFSGGYDAGYYSYIWSEVLDADTVEWFKENGGLTRANGDRFRSRLLGVGGSKDPSRPTATSAVATPTSRRS